VVGIVSFDDLPTDLTGSRFLEGKVPQALQRWLCQQARRLRKFAISHLEAQKGHGEDLALLTPLKSSTKLKPQ
jgi:hypothetical protein